MRTEQEKYLEVINKAHDFLRAFDELEPDSKQKLIKDILSVTSMQEIMNKIQMIMRNNGTY